ncbi:MULTISPECIES: hypothetical protein [Fischerella]|uniref:hypothetical protein n=1 Tax=Fischerella TaxID=1190 RepID=UPI0011AF41EF|nr:MULTISPECIES: hypothetical protein [Fischerella]MBD2430170.1 hypothetical protein [Fischerella sp. FACHB-380]
MKIRDRGLSYQQTHDPSVSIALHCGRFFMLSLWAIAPGVLVLVCKRKGSQRRTQRGGSAPLGVSPVVATAVAQSLATFVLSVSQD